MWVGVTKRFRTFHSNMFPSDNQIADANQKECNVRKCLHRAYYGQRTDTPAGLVVGSWGKNTAIAPPSDIDVFFELPTQEFERINNLSGNKQSRLLQEVKGHLEVTYPQTNVRGDGQVVTVAFNTITVEVVPVFRLNDQGQFLMPDTNDGGTWKAINPTADYSFIQASDLLSNNNVRPIIRMLKAWKKHCNVPIKSYQLELLVSDFFLNYEFREQDLFYYDWFARDFFVFLCSCANRNLTIPSTSENQNLGDDWLSRVITARDRAVKACEYEKSDFIGLAGEEWQKIFGTKIPEWV